MGVAALAKGSLTACTTVGAVGTAEAKIGAAVALHGAQASRVYAIDRAARPAGADLHGRLALKKCAATSLATLFENIRYADARRH